MNKHFTPYSGSNPIMFAPIGYYNSAEQNDLQLQNEVEMNKKIQMDVISRIAEIKESIIKKTHSKSRKKYSLSRIELIFDNIIQNCQGMNEDEIIDQIIDILDNRANNNKVSQEEMINSLNENSKSAMELFVPVKEEGINEEVS